MIFIFNQVLPQISNLICILSQLFYEYMVLSSTTGCSSQVTMGYKLKVYFVVGD